MSAAAAERPLDLAGDAVFDIATFLVRPPEENGLSAGDRAELRRMDPLDAGLPPAMWKLLTREKVASYVASHARDSRWQSQAERALAVVTQAVLEAGAPGESPIGRALGQSGYSEQRFVRLLRARELSDLATQVRQAARWCAVQGAGLRCTGGPGSFGRYILAAALRPQEADWRAHAIARDYFFATNKAGEPGATEP